MLKLWAVLKGLLVQEEADRTKTLAIEVDPTATTATKTTIKAKQTADRDLDLPDASDTLVGRATTDTLTNKTIDGDDNTVQDLALTSLKTEAGDASKFLQRNGAGTVVSGKDVPAGDVVGTTDTQTLTNKTIDGASNTITGVDADNVVVSPTGNLTADDVQEALEEHQTDLDGLEADKLEGPGTHADNLLPKFDGVNTNDMQTTGITVDDSDNITGVNDLTTLNDVVVGGDLTVNGTTTTINTDTLDVEDANITVNVGGNDVSAEGAGLTIERAGTDGSFVYEDALTSKFKLGASGSEVEVADVSSSQALTNKDLKSSTNLLTGASSDSFQRETGNQNTATIPDATSADSFVLEAHQQQLTNKDIDGGTASDNNRITIPQDTKANLDGLTRKEATLVFANDLDTLFVDTGSQLREVGSGGQGGINHIENPNAEINTDGWATYDDGFVSDPVDGTGGSANITLTRTTVGAEVLRDDASFKLSKDAANRQGEGTSYDFTIDNQDRGKELDISFDYNSSANYATDDITVHVYDVTNATLLAVNSGSLMSSGGSDRTFQGRFFAATDSTSYRLIIHIATTNATAYDVVFDNVRVGPKSFFNGATVTEWVEYTPTFVGFGTVSGVVFHSRRVGDTLEVLGNFLTGTTTGSTASVSFGFNGTDGNVTRDSTKLTASTVCGYYGTGVAAKINALLIAANDTSVGFSANDQTGNPVAPQTGTQVTSSSSISVQVAFKIPVVGWDSGSLLSTTQANDEVVSAKYGLTASTANSSVADAAYERIDFDSKVYDTHGAVTTGASWLFTAPSDGKYNVSSCATWANSTNLGDSQIRLFKNGSWVNTLGFDSGTSATLIHGSATVDLIANDTLHVEAFQDDTVGAARSFDTSGDASKLTYITIDKVPSLSAFGVVGVNEHVQETSSSTVAWPITAAQYGDLNSITLPAGEWDITAQWVCNASGLPGSVVQSQIGISTTSGNSSAGLNNGDNRLIGQVPNVAGQSTFMVLPNYRVNITNTTTYYLKAFLGVTTNLDLTGYRISARRIA